MISIQKIEICFKNKSKICKTNVKSEGTHTEALLLQLWVLLQSLFLKASLFLVVQMAKCTSLIPILFSVVGVNVE